jgi:hypothetical protein
MHAEDFNLCLTIAMTCSVFALWIGWALGRKYERDDRKKKK